MLRGISPGTGEIQMQPRSPYPRMEVQILVALDHGSATHAWHNQAQVVNVRMIIVGMVEVSASDGTESQHLQTKIGLSHDMATLQC